MSKRTGNVVGILFGIALVTYFAFCTIEVWYARETPTHTMTKANVWVAITRETVDCVVVDCVPRETAYEIYVVKGNDIYSYYDSETMENGMVLTVTFDGNEIINVKEKIK